nr:hypothetical protein [Tanacetum cinerariifolium]
MNDLQFKLDNIQQDFQKKFEQKQEDFLKQMRNFMQKFYDGPPIQPLEASEEQRQSMEDTMLELVKICQEKEFLCIHDDVNDLIESALDSKLLLINSNSQRHDKKEQEVKNVVEQPAERENRSIQSLQNFIVVHKSSTSFRDTSQISSIHAIAPIQSIKEPEHLLSMGYEHLSITPETESDEVTESNAENLLPIPSKCEVTLEDEIECDMSAKDVCSPVFTTFSNPLLNNDESLFDEDVPAEEFKIYSNPLFDEDEINSDKLDPHCFNDGDSQREEIDIVTEIDDVLPPSVENDDDLFNDPLLEEVDLFLSDNSIPLGIENDNPLIPRPPPEPPDAETDAGEEIPVVMNDKDKVVDYSSFIFFIYPEMFPLLLSVESEDAIFDPGIFD